MGEHDQRFKQLLREFLPEFVQLFFPQRAQHLDFSHVEWLDKEIFPTPVESAVYELDLVARLGYRLAEGGSDPALALVHVEVESRDAVATFRQRMYQYYEALRRRYNLPVLPIAVYLRVGLEGVGVDTYVETYEDLEVLRFQYHYVGLPALTAEQYVAGSNWLGVALAALMRIPTERRVWLRSEALRRVLLESHETDYRKFLLQECVESYLVLDEPQRQQYEALLQTEPFQEIRPMMTTTYEKGVLEGERRGTLRAVRLFLEARFGQLPPALLASLATLPQERLLALIPLAGKAEALDELGLDGTS
jgi:hypothetical protein